MVVERNALLSFTRCVRSQLVYKLPSLVHQLGKIDLVSSVTCQREIGKLYLEVSFSVSEQNPDRPLPPKINNRGPVNHRLYADRIISLSQSVKGQNLYAHTYSNKR